MQRSNPIKRFIEEYLSISVSQFAIRIGYSTQRIDNWIKRNKHPKTLPFEFYMLVEKNFNLSPSKVYLKFTEYMVEKSSGDFLIKCLTDEKIENLKINKKSEGILLECVKGKSQLFGVNLNQELDKPVSKQLEEFLQVDIAFDEKWKQEVYEEWRDGVKKANEEYKKIYYSLA